jgi:hypothetical protein
MPVVHELRHHLRLHAEAARLHGILRLALNVDHASVFEMHLEPAIRIAELAGAIDDFVRLKRAGLFCEIEAGHFCFRLWMRAVGRAWCVEAHQR